MAVRADGQPCGVKFSPWRWTQQFCSTKCRVRAFYWKFKAQNGQRYARAKGYRRKKEQKKE